MSDATRPASSIKESLLKHDTRRAIYDMIQERPGLDETQVADELDTHPRLVAYHVDRLVSHRVLAEAEGESGDKGEDESGGEGIDGGKRLLFHPSQEPLWQDPRLRLLFARPAVREIALYVTENPGVETREIENATGRDPDELRRQLQTLREHDLIETTTAGLARANEPTERLAWWHDQVGDAYETPWTTSGTGTGTGT